MTSLLSRLNIHSQYVGWHTRCLAIFSFWKTVSYRIGKLSGCCPVGRVPVFQRNVLSPSSGLIIKWGILIRSTAWWILRYDVITRPDMSDSLLTHWHQASLTSLMPFTKVKGEIWRTHVNCYIIHIIFCNSRLGSDMWFYSFCDGPLCTNLSNNSVERK
jgi:hypothetical protein